jgi:hypothetical protein
MKPVHGALQISLGRRLMRAENEGVPRFGSPGAQKFGDFGHFASADKIYATKS